MPDEHLPVYQIQDFHAQEQKESYFYLRSFAAHLREHQFIQRPHKHDYYIQLYISKGRQGRYTVGSCPTTRTATSSSSLLRISD